jgi:hypothetical protein
MESSKVRIRPLRFAFLVDPRDNARLQTVFEINSVLWGGCYNFIIPLFKRVPAHYKRPYDHLPSAKAMLKGLVEAYQPDFLVETEAGQASAAGLDFPIKRLLTIDTLMSRDDRGGCNYGIDLRTVCNVLYKEVFRFVQRHPPKVVIPVSTDPRYKLFFAAAFGRFPQDGLSKDVEGFYLGALDGKREELPPASFPDLFKTDVVFPLRATVHELETTRNSWSMGSHMFYIDPFSAHELIEFWNLRALGWRIRPVPIPLATDLIDFCNAFVKQEYWPYPPPSNAFNMVQFQSAPHRPIEELQAFVRQLTSPGPHAISISNHYPRVWEEWGRSADHAEPQTVSNATAEVDCSVIGKGLHLRSVLPEFAKDDQYAAQTYACANVLGDVEGGSPVIPWKSGVASSLTHNFVHEKTWISREGVVTFAGRFSFGTQIQLPNALNIFSAVAKSLGYELSLSAAGRTCEQIIASVGSLQMMRLVGSRDLIRLFDQMAHEDVEVELGTEGSEKRKRVAKAFAPRDKVLEAIRRSNGDWEIARTNHLDALIHKNILKLGIALVCDHCSHKSWFSLEDIGQEMVCPRCSSKFPFPSAGPAKDAWVYRVSGAFAASNYAQGAYCVASALAFITERIARTATWLPSFEMKHPDGSSFEADFGLFAKPNVYEHTSTPHLFLGECKSFNPFKPKDFSRARTAAKLFPGAILCFCTLNESFSPYEIRELSRLVIAGRKRLDVGKQINPVLLLTGKELFGQYRIESPYDIYGDKKEMAERVYMRNDIQETCDFTQQLYLGIESYYTWRDMKRQKIIARRAAKKKATA